jgi:hypothetical protein
MRRLFSLWVFSGYFIICALVAVWYSWELSSSNRDTIGLVIAFLAGGAAIYSLLLNVQMLRATAAARFIARWNDPQMREIREAIRRQPSSNIDRSKSDLNRDNAEAAHFFEELAISVLHNGADEHLLKDFFRSVVCEAHETLAIWIAEMRKIKNQQTAFEQFETLVRRWSKASPWERFRMTNVPSWATLKPWKFGIPIGNRK